MRRTSSRHLPLGDQVLPPALTDPGRQLARDRRWAKLTAHGSLVLAGFLGVLAQFFNGTKSEVVAEQQTQTRSDGGRLVPDETPGAQRFAGRIDLTRDT